MEDENSKTSLKISTTQVNSGPSKNFQESHNIDAKQNKRIPSAIKDGKNKDFIYTIGLFKDYKISIAKPLIPLKLAQFCYFGAGSYMLAFLIVHFKQRGVSLSQLSWMNVIAPVIQIMGTTITGVVADVIGKSKPVLIANLLFVMTIVIGILVMPPISSSTCENLLINFTCSTHNDQTATHLNECFIQSKDCSLQCLNESSKSYKEEYLLSDPIERTASQKIILKLNNTCDIAVSQLSPGFKITAGCNVFENQTCEIKNTICNEISSSKCHTEEIWNSILIGYIILYVLFLTAFSNVYRCFDVTCMSLVNEYNLSSFGRERFFAISGNLVISPLAGLLVDITSKKADEKNCATAFYLFICLILVVLTILFKLPASINPQGKKMSKSLVSLLKNIDFLSLIIVTLVLGTAWNFTKIYTFWYITDLGASSFLIGFIPSISALYGMPFLQSSKWFVKKCSSPNLIILALLGYTLQTFGYSLITNPWYSLLLEAFGGITYYLLWIAIVQYSHELAPDGMKATVVAVVGALHYSAGKATGGLCGGLVMNSYGGRIAFRVIAAICLITSILYSIYLRMRRCCVTKEMSLYSPKKSSRERNDPTPIYVLTKIY